MKFELELTPVEMAMMLDAITTHASNLRYSSVGYVGGKEYPPALEALYQKINEQIKKHLVIKENPQQMTAEG